MPPKEIPPVPVKVPAVDVKAAPAVKLKGPIPIEIIDVDVEDIKMKPKKKKSVQGIDDLMVQIQKHAFGKCHKVSTAVEIFDPPPKLWWHREPVQYAFRHPQVRSRLERLMGSNLVRLTDRKYMLSLHARILEEYIQRLNARITDREAQERDREKELVLTGIVPMDQAPKEMAQHPVLLINNYCQKLIAERRALIKVPKVVIPHYLYLDDTPDPPAGLSIVEGHVFRKPDDLICIPPETHLAFSDEQDVARGYMFPPAEYEKKQKYESPLVKDLANVKSVEEMYLLADQIIGPLKTIKEAGPVEVA